MKKSFLCMCVLFLLSLSALGTAHTQVANTSSSLAFQEERLSGDLAVAGIQLDMQANMGNRLFWDISMTPGQEPDVDFHFFAKQQYPDDLFSPYQFLDMYVNFTTSTGSNSGLDLDKQPIPSWMSKTVKQLADNTPPGEMRKTTIRVSDYISYYPLAADLSTTASRLFWHTIEDSQQTERPIPISHRFLLDLTGAFRFPVPEDHMLTISVIRDAAGNLTEYTSQDAGQSGVSVYTLSWASPDTLYFIVNAFVDRDGTPLSYSQTPGGYGIYCLPIQEGLYTLDDLKMICPLDPHHQVYQAIYDPACNQVLLSINSEQGRALHCIDLDTLEEVQQLPLSDWHGRSPYLCQDLLFLFHGDQTVRLYQRDADNRYVHQFDFTIPKELIPNNSPVFWDDQAFSFSYDGKQLALTIPLQTLDRDRSLFADRPVDTSFALYLFSAEGMLYSGRFFSSLDSGSETSALRCGLAPLNPIALSPT